MNNNNNNFAEDKDKDYDCGTNSIESPRKYNNKNILSFCLDVILKEAKEEGRLVKQIIYTMLSMYTDAPINLAINSPSGEGKTYVIQKVGENFPEEDVMFLAQMTDKALFHRQGVLVIRNEQTGQYEPLKNLLAEKDIQIEDNIYCVNLSSFNLAFILYSVLPFRLRDLFLLN